IRHRGACPDTSIVRHIDQPRLSCRVPGAGVPVPSAQRAPLISQAGASTRGRAFAAKHAEATFVTSPTPALLAKSVADTRDELVKAGRDPYDIRIFGMQTIVTAATDAEAQEKYRQLASYADIEGALVLMSGWMGTDFSQ